MGVKTEKQLSNRYNSPSGSRRRAIISYNIASIMCSQLALNYFRIVRLRIKQPPPYSVIL